MTNITITGITDFKLEHILECGQCFRWIPAPDESGDYIGIARGYVARAHYDESSQEMRASNLGANEAISTEGGSLTLETSGGSEKFWHDYFDLGTDYGRIKEEIIARDPKIEIATKYGYGIRILRQDLFETIVSFIISQNNNIPRIKKNIEALCERYGEPLGEYFGEMRYAFPTPSALAAAEIEDLAKLRLGYRSAYIKAAGEKFFHYEESLRAMKDKCEEDELREHVMKRDDIISFHGVGPKVANCIMLFGLRQMDAFPIDTWVKHIMNDMYGFRENDVKGMAEFASKNFGKNAGYAQQYLFYYYRDSSISHRKAKPIEE